MSSPYVPQQPVTTVRKVEAILGEQFENQVEKVIDHLEEHCRAWIERSPFVVLSSPWSGRSRPMTPPHGGNMPWSET